MAASSTHIFWLFASTLMMTVGAIAFLFGAPYGMGLAILSVVFFSAGWWITGTLKVERAIERFHTHVVSTSPRLLTMVPLQVAKLAARQQRSHQSQVNNYLTRLAKYVNTHEGYCECCGTSQPLIGRFPFDPHFHSRDCEVAIGWRDYGNPEVCPWGILFELPGPVLVSQLSEQSVRGLYRFAINQAETYGYGNSAYFKALGAEYLRHEVISQPDDFLERVGRKVAQEYRLEEIVEKELLLIEN